MTQAESANGYRLPTDAEWEWAARGGVESRGYKFSGSDDVNAVGWYYENSKDSAVDLGSMMNAVDWIGRGTFPVAQKKRNELELFDMSGNVWEWCWDSVGTNSRIRGGSWIIGELGCAVSVRDDYNSHGRCTRSGLRLARSL